MSRLLIRNVEVDGVGGLAIRLAAGRIEAIDEKLDAAGCEELDGGGGAVLPGLIDHHLHLFGLAAALHSVEASAQATPDAASFARALRRADAGLPAEAWLRVVGYDDAVAGPLDRQALDRLVPARPTKLQYRTGGLWVLNSAALARLPPQAGWPAGVERDALGNPTGRIFREDRWLREALGGAAPSLRTVKEQLDRFGVIGVTDASVTTDAATAQALATAVELAGMRQRLHLMSGGALTAPADARFSVGPVKILLDDDQLGDPAQMVQTVQRARGWNRAVAVHCVTAGELAYALAAFQEAGTRPGDRIEHGGVIDNAAAEAVAALALTVVTQPGFVLDRGDRYLAQVDPRDHPSLYRIAGLRRRGVALAASSDAPYATLDPWRAMRAAVDRRTRSGAVLGADEAVDARTALSMYLGAFVDPGGPPRRVAVGEPADLCLMSAPLRTVLGELSSELVAATLIGGRLASG